MKQYNTFIFDSYAFDEKTGTVTLNYSLDDEVKFTETLIIPLPKDYKLPATSYQFEAALFALHLIGGISYYKTCLPKKMEIRSGKLSEDQAKFWNDVYENGLGEFFYRNQIDFRGLISFPVTKHVEVTSHDVVMSHESRVMRKDANDSVEDSESITQDSRLETHDFSEKTGNQTQSPQKRCLVPIGGGKDSIVTIELLKKAGYDVTLFRMEAHPIIDHLMVLALEDLPILEVRRSLSPLLFELNKEGALNGHIPITAYLSVVTIIMSILHGFDAVILSNERSSNYGNTEYLGKNINHQWSKSLDFEKAFQSYLKNTIRTDIQYFSLLRPLSELHIVRMFTRYPQYFCLATSCNANWKILKEGGSNKYWCCKCPKCAFVFALYAAFVPKPQLMEIFGADLFEDETLIPLYKELLGIEGFKPFECVGTPEETLTAFILAHERGDLSDTAIMKMALEECVLPDDVHGMVKEQFTPSTDHSIPAEFMPIVIPD